MPDKKVLVGDDVPKNQPQEPQKEAAPQEPAKDQQTKDAEKNAEQGKLYAGKFKSPEDLEKSYSELEKKLGEQGNKLGETEKEKSILMSHLENLKNQNEQEQSKAEPANDFEGQIKKIADAVEQGDLSIAEGMAQTAKISAQMASSEAVNGVQQAQQKQQIEVSKAKFAEEHPDFFDLQRSGALEQIKSQLPGFHDDVSAYFELKNQQSQANFQTELEAAKAQAFEAGKAEMAKLADGDKNTQKVLQSGGKTASEIGRKQGPFKQSELRASGLEALKRARGE